MFKRLIRRIAFHWHGPRYAALLGRRIKEHESVIWEKNKLIDHYLAKIRDLMIQILEMQKKHKEELKKARKNG